MRVSASDRDRLFFIKSEARRRLPGRGNRHRTSSFCTAARDRGNAAHAAQEVECDAFGDKNTPNRSYDAQNGIVFFDNVSITA